MIPLSQREYIMERAGIAVHVVTADDAPRFSPYVGLPYRTRLTDDVAAGKLLVVGASLLGRAVGAGLATRRPNSGWATIQSLVVAGPWRRQGLASALLDTLHTEHQGLIVDGYFPAAHRHRSAIDALIVSAGWSQPEPRFFRYHCALSPSMWMSRPLRSELAQEPTIRTMNDADVGPISALVARGNVPTGLDPFVEGRASDSATTHVARQNGAIAGWVTSHRREPDRTEWTSLWVDPGARRRRLGPALMAASLRYAYETGVRRCTWLVSTDNFRMVRLSERHERFQLTKEVLLGSSRDFRNFV